MADGVPHNYIWDDTDQHAPGLAGYNGQDCATNSTGMARWWVSEPYCTLWLEDEPLGYQPSRGPKVSFHLSYTDRNQRDTNLFAQYAYSFGQGWECSWMSSLGADTFSTSGGTNASFTAMVYLPGGGVERYSVAAQNLSANNWPADPVSQTWLVPTLSGTTLVGFERRFADGSKDIYQTAGPGTNFVANYHLTSRL